MVELGHRRICTWAMAHCPEAARSSKWAPWDMYLDWLYQNGWRLVGTFGTMRFHDESGEFLAVVAADDPQCDPQLPEA